MNLTYKNHLTDVQYHNRLHLWNFWKSPDSPSQLSLQILCSFVKNSGWITHNWFNKSHISQLPESCKKVGWGLFVATRQPKSCCLTAENKPHKLQFHRQELQKHKFCLLHEPWLHTTKTSNCGDVVFSTNYDETIISGVVSAQLKSRALEQERSCRSHARLAVTVPRHGPLPHGFLLPVT